MVRGEIWYKNGDFYEGELCGGKLEGKGVYKFQNGSVYEGEFKNNSFHGRGKLTDKFNELMVVGEFREGKAHGLVRIVYGDGA